MDVGIDLAWGARAPTGLAALADDGRLADARAVRTDEEILDWLRRTAPDDVVAGVDAPLVVVNDTGMRGCERAVGRRFGAAGASCHPANRGMAAFADGGRAARLCRLAVLEIDPSGPAPRRAIEVYPHAALVALFDLPRVLAYKDKPGRDLAGMRVQMLRLAALLESLRDAPVPLRVTAWAGWPDLVAAVRGAATKAALRRAEDVLDAVVCAYVARLSRVAPEQVEGFGDRAEGRIVVPAKVANRSRPGPPAGL